MRKIKLLFTATLSMIAWTGVMAQTAAEYEAALAAITDGGTYRIATTVDETKYYVTNSGGLSTTKAAGGVFTFAKIPEGGAYVYDGENTAVGIQITSTDNKRFTNGPLSDNHADLDVSNFATSTNNRNDWETQVFFLNDAGKYAIRTCNTATATESWGDAGRTFWTYKIEPVTPQYSYEPAFVWELEEYSVTPEQEAAAATFRAWPFFIQSAAGLVKSADKFYSNAKESSEGSYEALLDDDYSSFFHSSWSAEAGGTHYLQAELSEATQKFQFYFKKRQQNNNNRPTKIIVSASNDGEEFTEITTLEGDFPTSEFVIDYMSDAIDLGAAYKYVRFTVEATNNDAKNGAGEVFFTFSEFYMLPDAVAQIAPYYNKYTASTVDEFTDADITMINTIDGILKSMVSTVNVTYALYDAEGNLIDSKVVVQEPNSEVNVPTSLTPASPFYDYTVTGTVGTSDCEIIVVRTLKAGYVGALADLSNDKAYFITCDRGKFLTKDDHLASTAHSSLTDAEPSAFAILNYEDNYYLYSVADSKFVTNTGALAGNLMTDGFHGTFDAIQMTPKTVPYFFWYFTVAEGTNYGLNTNGNDPYGYVINSWMNADPGNQYYMVEAADFDPTEALAALDAYFNPSFTVTYVVKNEAGDVIFTSDPQPTTEGAVITTLPDDFKRGYYTYNETEVTVTDTRTIAEFTATWNGPFEISADFATAHWYNMTMRGTWYVTSDAKDANDGDAYVTKNANTIGLGEDSYQWAFMGNGYEGIKIINKAEGEGMSFGWTDAQAKDKGIPTVMPDEEGNHGWKVVPSTNTSVPAGSFCLNVPGTNLYINQYGGAGGKVKFWDSANNIGDPGSAFTVYDVPTDFSEYVVSEIAPAMEATGYFTFTDEAKASIGYDPAYTENCPFDAFKSMKQKIAEAMSDVSNFVLPETGYYTLNCKLYGTYLGIDPSDANIYGNYKTAEAAKQIVKLEKLADDAYTISLMGKFAPVTVGQSAQVTATAEAGVYIVSVPSVGYAAFQADPEAAYSCLHCASGGSVVGWVASADASQWAVADAVSIKLAVGEEGYATAYLPFPVVLDAPLTVPTPKGAWTFDDGTTTGTGISTLTASEGVTFADGAVTVPVGEKLTMATNANGDLTTYSFMMDVKIINENNNKYTALYSNKPNNDADGSLFFYNHSKNGRGIGLNYCGLGYGAQGSVEVDTWYRVIFVCEDGVGAVYLDGVKVAQAASSSTTSTQGDHWTMRDVALFFADDSGEENEVACDELRFWDVALSEDEVAKLGTVGTVVSTAAPDMKVYTGRALGEKLWITELEGTIPAATPVILQASPDTYVFAITEDVDPIEKQNDLKGTFEPIEATGKYVLAKPEGKEIGFYKAESGTIAAGKAYLEIESGDATIKEFLFTTDDPTGIANVEKAVENGAIYNVAGQRLSKVQKGINIINGKKILK